jgi:Zn-finger nucleic acid-binding protein
VATASATGHPSAFDGLRLSCPVCSAMTDLTLQVGRWACRGCDGLFVEYRTLEAMVQEITHQPWHVPVADGRAGKRACPVCSSKMLVETLERITIDRCPSHGMWFDREELASMLEAALSNSTTAGWLKRLFT